MSFLGPLHQTALLALALVVANPGLAEAKKSVAKGSGASALVAKAAKISKTVSKLRGLPLKSKIRSGVMNKPQIRARILKILHEEYTKAELDAESLSMKRFGLLTASQDYVKILVKLLQDQIAGFYDPAEKKLFIAGWAPMGGDMLMAHEIDHALQDQHFDLKTFMKDDKRNGDFLGARQALVEGDGMALMLEFQLASMNQAPPWGNALVLSMIKQSMASGMGDMGKVPLAMREGLIFPYVAGLEFIAHFRKHHNWSAIDAIYKKPPLSTEHILHPAKYESYEQPIAVSAHLPPLLTAYREAMSSVQGEKGVEIFLRSNGVSEERAVLAAGGWGGDRMALYVKKGHTGSKLAGSIGVSLSNWDDEDEAKEFFEALEHALPSLARGSQSKRGDKILQYAVGKKGQLLAERRGSNVLILIDAPNQSAEALRKGIWQSWTVGSPPLVPTLPN